MAKVLSLTGGTTEIDDTELEDETFVTDRQKTIECIAQFKTTEMINLLIDDWLKLQQKLWTTTTPIQLMKTIPQSEMITRHRSDTPQTSLNHTRATCHRI